MLEGIHFGAHTVSRCENGSGAMVDTLARMQQSLEAQAWFSAGKHALILVRLESRPRHVSTAATARSSSATDLTRANTRSPR